MTEKWRPLPFWRKASLAMRAWFWCFAVVVGLRRHPLPRLVERLGQVDRLRDVRLAPARLSRGMARSLRVGPMRPRCLVRALVLYRLLREQGDPAEVVIGMAPTPRSHKAHAWVEIDRMDIGPDPGRNGYLELVRYG